jgi:hypothetical protein
MPQPNYTSDSLRIQCNSRVTSEIGHTSFWGSALRAQASAIGVCGVLFVSRRTGLRSTCETDEPGENSTTRDFASCKPSQTGARGTPWRAPTRIFRRFRSASTPRVASTLQVAYPPPASTSATEVFSGTEGRSRSKSSPVATQRRFRVRVMRPG